MKYFEYDSKASEFDNKKNFILYCILNFCQCKKSCLQVTQYSFDENQQMEINRVYSKSQQNLSKCSVIRLENDEYRFDFIKNLNKIIEFMISIGLLKRKKSNWGFLVRYKSENRFKQFSWKNIGILSQADREMFWFFRKVVVDSILKNALQEKFLDKLDDVKILSVGSNKLSSDYDITLYTNKTFYDNQKIKTHFSDTLNSLLGSVDSDKLFDTNIYTTSYITFRADKKILYESYKKHKCSDTIFYYVKYNEMTSLSENVWAFLHFYKIIYESFSHDIATTIWQYVYNKLQKDAEHLKLLPELYDKISNMYSGDFDIFYKLHCSQDNDIRKLNITNKNLENIKSPSIPRRISSSMMNFFIEKRRVSKTKNKKNDEEPRYNMHQETQKNNTIATSPSTSKSSEKIKDLKIYTTNGRQIQKEDNLLNLPSRPRISKLDCELLSFYDTIAFINFHSKDTYFTRGAFLDIVVNCQMCHNKYEKLLLTDNDYFNSFVENISFLLSYPNSDKYISRITDCIINMRILDYNRKFQEQFIKYLAKIKMVQESCKRDKIVSVSEISLQDCNYYALFQSCIKLLTNVSSIYFSKNSYSELDKKLRLISGEKYAVPLYDILDYEI